MRVRGGGSNGVQGKSPGPHWKLVTFSYFRDFLKNKFGKFRQHSENNSVSASIGVEHSPTLHILLRLASADCHCMLSGESRISSNMTISAFYRKQKLRFNVPRTYLCLIILDKIGLPLAIGQYRPFQMEPSHCHIISFSPFKKLTLYLNGWTFQRLKVSRPIISASTHFYMHFGV